MADFRSRYQGTVVRRTEIILTEIGERTNETEARLNKLAKISEVAESINEETSRDHHYIELIGKCLTNLLFGPYTVLLARLAHSLSTVKKMENKQKENKLFQLPEVMQKRVDSFKHYLEKAEGRLDGIDKVIDELMEKVYEAKGKHFEISDEEMAFLEMNAAKVDRGLEACKKYLDEAQNEINKLESDIALEMEAYDMKVKAVSYGIGVVLMIGAAYFIPKATLKELAEDLKKGGLLSDGAELAVNCFRVSYSVIIQEHKKSFTPHLENLKEELGKVKTEYEINKSDFEKYVTKNMEATH
ncbi:uncharacterized protein [Montipora capricornis]|uniref:uncharacterized protein isoform X1 n=1 Tax=Montipora capricornis TaxID=246305 RepID=UPI0035F1237F